TQPNPNNQTKPTKRLANTEKETLDKAIATWADAGVLVNDIDIKRKIFYYTIFGKGALLRH
ncbi:MAG: hypothetical protein WCI04_04035, partial [archaeon]